MCEVILQVMLMLGLLCRDRRRQREDDPGHDLDHHPALRHPGHLRGGDDGQGGPAALVPEEDRALQERQRTKLPSQVRKRFLEIFTSGS